LDLNLKDLYAPARLKKMHKNKTSKRLAFKFGCTAPFLLFTNKTLKVSIYEKEKKKVLVKKFLFRPKTNSNKAESHYKGFEWSCLS